MKHRIVRLLLTDLTALRWLLGWLGIMFAGGLLLADNHSGAYNLMLQIAPSALWAAAFVFYGCERLYSCLTDNPKYSDIIGTFVGFWLWCYTFFSFTSNPIRHFGSADIMILVIVACEVWIAASAISENWSK
jgi:hypothetical protein